MQMLDLLKGGATGAEEKVLEMKGKKRKFHIEV